MCPHGRGLNQGQGQRQGCLRKDCRRKNDGWDRYPIRLRRFVLCSKRRRYRASGDTASHVGADT